MTRQGWLLILLYAARGFPLTWSQVKAAMLLLGTQLPEVVGQDYYCFKKDLLGPTSKELWEDLHACVGNLSVYNLHTCVGDLSMYKMLNDLGNFYAISLRGATHIEQFYKDISLETRSAVLEIVNRVLSTSLQSRYIDSIATQNIERSKVGSYAVSA